MSASLDEFIRARFVLEPLPFRPDISLYLPTPQSGLIGFLEGAGLADKPPYWAYAWAGGAALALYLRDHPQSVAGRSVLDFGAGSGLVGIAAAKAGAQSVLAFEPDLVGNQAWPINAEANGVNLTPGTADSAADIVLAGDVFYDSEIAAQALPVLEAHARRGARVLVGDPFRRDLPRTALDLLAEYDVPDMGGPAPLRAGVFALHG